MKKITFFSISLSIITVFILSSAAYSFALDQAQFDKLMNNFLASEKNVEKLGTALEQMMLKKRQDFFKKQAQEEEKKAEKQFENPVKIDISTAPVKGDAKAPITIVEFSDFECPFCQRGANIIDEVVAKNKGKVKLAFLNFPLGMHANAKPAAIAAMAAHEQNKFWEMHDK